MVNNDSIDNLINVKQKEQLLSQIIIKSDELNWKRQTVMKLVNENEKLKNDTIIKERNYKKINGIIIKFNRELSLNRKKLVRLENRKSWKYTAPIRKIGIKLKEITRN